MQNDLRVFWVVLVPGVVQCLTRSGNRDRGNELYLKTLSLQEVSEVPMVVGSGLQGDLQHALKSLEIGSELAEITQLIADDHLSALACR